MKGTFLSFIIFVSVLALPGPQDSETGTNWKTVQGDKSVDIMVSETNRMFVIRCEDKRTYAFVVWGEFVGTLQKLNIKRINSLQRSNTGNRTDGGSSFFPSRTIEFLKTNGGQQHAVDKSNPHRQSPLTAEFNVSGIEEALDPIREPCKWR